MTPNPNENQAEKNSAEQACVESIRKTLSIFFSELQARTAIQQAVATERDSLRAELSTLRKELEAAKKNAGEVLNEMRAYCGECEFDETDPMKPSFDCLKRITGELLNNGKDEK